MIRLIPFAHRLPISSLGVVGILATLALALWAPPTRAGMPALWSGQALPDSAQPDSADVVVTPPAPSPAPSASPRSAPVLPDGSIATTYEGLSELGLENVSVESSDRPLIAFENRRYRHTADVLGLLHRHIPNFVAFERRLGLVGAAIEVNDGGGRPTFRVRYPSDSDFPRPPSGPVADRTSHSVDVLMRPQFSYELGRLTAPIQVQIQAEPLVRYNPWPGGRLSASVMIPIYNTFDFSDIHPDAEEVRPGVATLDQFLWVPRVALTSFTGGLLGENRYGMSFGAARPIAGGRLLAEGQVDLTGFIAFENTGVAYSSMTVFSSFGGLTWSVPKFDASVRVRGGQFLYGDHGVHAEFRRSFGDFDYGLFMVRAGDITLQGVRVSLPIPPMTRATHDRVRLQPVERLPISYRTDASPVGIFVSGIASREEFLRQLTEPSLEANRDRFERRRAGRRRPFFSEGPVQWVNMLGTSGFIATPWADALGDGVVSLDYSHVPKKWSYSGRGEHVNQIYSMSIGLLPRIEASLRFTRIPGDQGFIDLDPDNLLTTDTDHMASGRLVLLTPREGHPGLAIGIEDVSGTRRFHSTYVVAGLPAKIKYVQSRFSLGYAPRVFTATRRVLDGGFGAIEVSPWRVVAARMEYDSEKWNLGVGVALPYGLRLRASALDLETLSVGAGWTHEL